MSFIPVLMYFTGLAVFGFSYWLLDGILSIFRGTNIANTTTYHSYPLLLMLWAGIVVVYLIFGGIWLVRKYNEIEQMGGGF
jgi:hypothetical protein